LRPSAKMAKRKKDAAKPQNPLDTFYGKRGRGRPGVRASEIAGRSYNYRLIFSQIWDAVGGALLRATTEAEVIQAFEKDGRYTNEFRHIGPLILKVRSEKRFPKKREAQIGFLADSLAGLGRISPRRSRDICDAERAKQRKKSKHRILRQEYYVECSCGYKGPALDNACRVCGAEIPLSLGWVHSLGFR